MYKLEDSSVSLDFKPNVLVVNGRFLGWGIQEETTILGVPCMTLRENTERPVTITEGTNRLVHVTAEDILKNYRGIRDNENSYCARVPKLWDGKAAERIAKIIAEA